MWNALLIQRLFIVCPVCRSSDFVAHRRLPGGRSGSVLAHCACRRCGLTFKYEEDKRGRVVRK